MRVSGVGVQAAVTASHTEEDRAGAIDDEPPSLPGPLGVIRKIDSGLGVSVAHSLLPSSSPDRGSEALVKMSVEARRCGLESWCGRGDSASRVSPGPSSCRRVPFLACFRMVPPFALLSGPVQYRGVREPSRAS